MKPSLQPKKTWSWLRSTSLVVMALTTALMSTACGKKDGDAQAPMVVPPPPPPPTGPLVPGCAGCPPGPTGSAFIASAIGNDFYYSYNQAEHEISLEFFGQGSGSSLQGYSGAVYAQGVLNVFMAQPICNLPAGQYSLTTSQPGQWASTQSFGGLTLVGYGPTQISVYIPGGYLKSSIPAATGSDGRQYPFRINGRALITAPGGAYPCDSYIE